MVYISACPGKGIGEYNRAQDTWYVRGVGRPAKIDRQELVGTLVAVEQWCAADHEARIAAAKAKCEGLCLALTNPKMVRQLIK